MALPADPTATLASPAEILVAEVRLAAVSGVGPLLRRRLVDRFGSAASVLLASRDQLTSVPGVGPKLAAAVSEAPGDAAARTMLAEAAAAGIGAICEGDADYPAPLAELEDHPAVLYIRGAIEPRDARAVAIVGARRPTRYGLRMAETLAADLARAGVTVVSGLARGIDGAAHRGAIQAGGRTIAVLAGGLLRIYPPEHVRLADEVAARGALVAESAPHMPPMAGSFPQRNRIISGLSLAIVVVEAAERSGALITARHAGEQGRDVLAVPGPADSPMSQGCLALIQDGAKLVRHAGDVLEEIDGAPSASRLLAARPRVGRRVGAEPPHPGRGAEGGTDAKVDRPRTPDEEVVWAAAGREPRSIDALIDATGLPAERVLAAVLLLETAGDLRRVGGASVVRP